MYTYTLSYSRTREKGCWGIADCLSLPLVPEKLKLSNLLFQETSKLHNEANIVIITIWHDWEQFCLEINMLIFT